MSAHQIRVRFEPQGRAVSVLPGSTILEAAARAGLTLDTPCGGEGTCGKCQVRLLEGAGAPSTEDETFFSEKELGQGWRLACQHTLEGDACVEIPASSLFASQHQIMETSATGQVGQILPAVRKQYVELAVPSMHDHRPDLVRLEDEVGPLKIDLDLLRQLPARLRQNRFKGTAVLTGQHLISFEPSDTTAHCYGIAFDIGTTTIVGALLDLRDGTELAVTSRMNPQVKFGDDVLTRINHSASVAEGLTQLHRSVTADLDEMIGELCAQAGAQREYVYELAFAGNTTMEHLLCGIDPEQLGKVPFVPAYGRSLIIPARQMDLGINERGFAYVFPVIGGFVGGDTVACMLATRMAQQEGPVLMIDIGTNGELVLADGEQLLAASTAAGPAFEGARISCGMRAANGAIEKVLLNHDVQLSVIGDSAPAGICGSGLIDLVAQMLDKGLITERGTLVWGDDLPADLSPALARRVMRGAQGEVEFVLAEADQSSHGRPVSIRQDDIRQLQLGSAALRAGAQILLKTAGLEVGDLSAVLIAGGFGSYIQRESALRIGLLPEDIPVGRIHYVGNASLSGARWALLSTQARHEAQRLASLTRHVELANDMDFALNYAQAMIFPASPQAR